MHAHILVGGNSTLRAQYLAKLRPPESALLHLSADQTSITIQQIHSLIGSLVLSARIPRLIWIEEANLLTLPAQNALLKLLEDPPARTQLYLTCQVATMLLPTIRSRCALIRLSPAVSLPNQLRLGDLKAMMSQNYGLRLTQLAKLDRDAALAWVIQLESDIRDQLYAPHLTPQQFSLLNSIGQSLLKTHEQLSHNVGVTLSLESLLLHLPKLK